MSRSRSINDRKGQIALFLVIAFVILIGVIYFIFLTKPKEEITEVSLEAAPVQSYVESCLGAVTLDGLYQLGFHGMYFEQPALGEPYYTLLLPYYWYNGTSMLPPLWFIQEQISLYVSYVIPFCTGNFSQFEEMGYSIETEEASAETTIGEKTVAVTLTYPLTVRKDNTETRLTKFRKTIEFNFMDKYETVRRILEKQEETPDMVPISFINSLAYYNDIKVETIYLGNGSMLFTLIFLEGPEISYMYSYLMKYNWSDEVEVVEKPRIEQIPVLQIDRSEQYSYQVKAIGTDLTFSDFTDIFDIDDEGWIRFYPTDLLNGEHHVMVKVTDSEGESDIALVKMIINIPSENPVVEQIGDLTAKVGEEFAYTVNASDPYNKTLFFVDDTSLFDIDTLTGEIRFTPSTAGNYTINIVVVNDLGRSNYSPMKLEVLE